MRSRAVVTQPDTGLPVPGARAALRAFHQPETSIASGLGGYRVSRAIAEGRVARNLSSHVQLAGEVVVERGWYAFTDAAALVPAGVGDLDGEATGVRALLGGSVSLSRSLGFTLAANLKWGWMDGADMGEGFQPGAVGAVRVRAFGKTDLFVGASYTQGLEGDGYIVPIFGLGGGGSEGKRSRWNVTARGAGAALTYDVTGRLSVGLVAGYERRDIRLAPGSRLSDGVLRERRLPVGLEIGWRWRRDSLVLLTVGASVWNRFTLLDRDGAVVQRETTDPAPFVQLEWNAKF